MVMDDTMAITWLLRPVNGRLAIISVLLQVFALSCEANFYTFDSIILQASLIIKLKYFFSIYLYLKSVTQNVAVAIIISERILMVKVRHFPLPAKESKTVQTHATRDLGVQASNIITEGIKTMRVERTLVDKLTSERPGFRKIGHPA